MPNAHNMSEATKEKIKLYQREYQRGYKARNPEKVQRYRIASAIHLLNQNGFLTIPMPPPPPWTDNQKAIIISEMEVSVHEQGAKAE